MPAPSAIFDAVHAHLDLAVDHPSIHPGPVPDGTSAPWASVHMDGGTSDSTSFVDAQDQLDQTISVVIGAASDAQCRLAQDRIDAALRGAVVTVDGWTCQPIRHDITTSIVPDTGDTPAVVSCTSTWLIRSYGDPNG